MDRSKDRLWVWFGGSVDDRWVARTKYVSRRCSPPTLPETMFMQALRKKVDALAYHRSCLAAELARARDAVRAGVAENAAQISHRSHAVAYSPSKVSRKGKEVLLALSKRISRGPDPLHM